MTGRGRDARLSDAQRSALWYLGCGYRIHRGKIGPAGAVWLKRPGEAGGSLAVAHRVLDALLSRGLVEFDYDAGGSRAYRLTTKGRAVADEIRAQHEKGGRAHED